MASRGSCQDLFMALLGKNSTTDEWIRILMTTNRCDEHLDLSAHRASFAYDIGDESMDNIWKGRADGVDRTRARLACAKYECHTRATLMKALTWPNYFRYQVDAHPYMVVLAPIVAILAGLGMRRLFTHKISVCD